MLAHHNHQDTYGYLPHYAAPISMGYDTYTEDWKNGGWNYQGTFTSYLVQILPYVEQANIFNKIMDKVKQKNPDGVFPADNTSSSGTESNPYRFPISAYWCPSDPNAPTVVKMPSRSNYWCCRGDLAGQVNTVSPRSAYRKGIQPTTMNKVTVSLTDILDGTSNTILVGEGIIPAWHYTTWNTPMKHPKKGGIAMLDTSISGDGSTNLNTLIAAVQYDPANPSLYKNDVTISSGVQRLQGMIYSFCRIVQFYTMMPPNGPFCAYNTSGCPELNNAASASSYHSGGVNVGFADGAVRFIPDTIDVGNNISVNVRTHFGVSSKPREKGIGKSPWGVWGALGTINGSESVAL